MNYIVIFLIIIIFIVYFRPFIDIQNIHNKTYIILWYNYKGERFYKYLYKGG